MRVEVPLLLESLIRFIDSREDVRSSRCSWVPKVVVPPFASVIVLSSRICLLDSAIVFLTILRNCLVEILILQQLHDNP